MYRIVLKLESALIARTLLISNINEYHFKNMWTYDLSIERQYKRELNRNIFV